MEKNLQVTILQQSVFLIISSPKQRCGRWTVTRNKKPCSLNKFEQSPADLQPGLQVSSNSLCHGLVLKNHKMVEIQICSLSCKTNEKESSSNDHLTISIFHYFISKIKMRYMDCNTKQKTLLFK